MIPDVVRIVTLPKKKRLLIFICSDAALALRASVEARSARVWNATAVHPNNLRDSKTLLLLLNIDTEVPHSTFAGHNPIIT